MNTKFIATEYDAEGNVIVSIESYDFEWEAQHRAAEWDTDDESYGIEGYARVWAVYIVSGLVTARVVYGTEPTEGEKAYFWEQYHQYVFGRLGF